jgi:hypothetical protein
MGLIDWEKIESANISVIGNDEDTADQYFNILVNVSMLV